MSKGESSKEKSKKYFAKKNYKPGIKLNSKGFLCTCNNREKDCIKESYNLLNQYADKLYVTAEVAEDDHGSEEDIGDSLTKEISNLKEENKPNVKRFQVIQSGANNVLFICTTLDNPVELAETIVKDIYDSGNQKTKFLLRLIPVEVTCKANAGDIEKAFMPLAEKYFKNSPQIFSVIFNHRNNNSVSKDDIIKLIADKVFATRSDHKVDLKGANISIIVEVIRSFAFLSVVPNYLKYKKYNLLAVSSQEEIKEEGTSVAS